MLGSLEKEVVSALKVFGKATTRVLLKEMRKKNVDVAYTTVSTILTRLHKKGLVKRTKGTYKGRVRYIYVYKDIEDEYIDGLISGLVKVFGTKGIVHLSARIDKLSEEELGEMRKRLKI
ncbi:MAG: BlaI/MecI/CopY family transcriptional regulator [Thermoplasmata archaeon]